MKIISILLKKEISQKISGLKNKSKDVFGIILNVLIIAFLVGVFVFAFSYFVKTYANVKIGYFANVKDRVFEIITIFYFLLITLLTIIGISKLSKNLIEAGDMSLLALPVTPFQIFISKILGTYLNLAFTSLTLSLSVYIIVVVQGLLPVGAIFAGVLFSLLVPIIALGLASFLTIPYYFIKKWLSHHFVLQLIFYIVVMAGLFIVYSLFLSFVKGLIESGQILFFFNEATVLFISKVCKFLVPSNLFASIIMGKNVAANIIFVLLFLLAFVGIYLYFGRFIFKLVRQNKISKKDDFILRKKIKKQRSLTFALICREFVNVLRTPKLAFSYFAIVASLPLMVLVTSGITISMMRELTMLNCDFEIVLCSLCMFSVLLNSFCVNNISRDGKFFNLLKTFPISPKRVVFSKILFCFITSMTSILFSGILVLMYNYVSPLKALVCVVICAGINFAVICIATRKDLNTTKEKIEDENPASGNFLTFWGLVLSAGLTVVSFVMSIYLQTRFSLYVSSAFTCITLVAISALAVGVALLYLLKNLNKKLEEVVQ